MSEHQQLEALRVVARTLLSEGLERDQLYEIMGHMQRGLVDSGRERDLDIILSLMDELSGWCSPGSEL